MKYDMKYELRYPNDPKAQKQWEMVCSEFKNAEISRKKFIRDYKNGKIPRTIMNAARFICYRRASK